MVLGGLFDRFPELRIILGQLGEGLPFLLDRMDEAFKREGSKPMEFKRTFCNHFYIATSGNLSTPALLCSILEMGIDRILLSVDWPFVENLPGMRWMETVPSPRRIRSRSSTATRRLLKM
jgi:predicted TIM-barrel fold metal-dependent hydrolase